MERNFFLLSRDMNPYEEKPAETGSKEDKINRLISYA